LSFRVASSVTRERERGTLDALLTLPVRCEDILAAKWLGGILRQEKLAYVLLGVLTIGLFTGALHPLPVLLLLVALAVHAAFLASLALWLSVVCPSTFWARFGMALALLIFFAGGWAVRTALDLRDGGWLDRLSAVGLNPQVSWWFLNFSSSQPPAR